MRMRVHCHHCAETVKPATSKIVRFTELGAYDYTCVAGHRSIVYLQGSRYHILAEIALQAIVDGYYREAITSFTACLERFYQFYSACVFRQHEKKASFDEAWKTVSKQSERQFGMFLGLFTLENDRAPPTLSGRQVEFRNKVTHQGYIPDEKATISFGQDVINIIQPIIYDMWKKYKEVMQDGIVESQRRGWQELDPFDKFPHIVYAPDLVLISDLIGGTEIPDLKALVSQRTEHPLEAW